MYVLYFELQSYNFFLKPTIFFALFNPNGFPAGSLRRTDFVVMVLSPTVCERKGCLCITPLPVCYVQWSDMGRLCNRVLITV